MTNDTLKITYGQAAELRRDGRERLERAVEGETEGIEQEYLFIINFGDYADVEQLMRSSNIELLEAIIDDEPASISEAADAVDRDYKDVHRNLKELESLGVIEFVQDGTSKKPILRKGASTIEFSLHLAKHADIENQSGTPA